jgi:hypothetical protein
MSGTLTVGLVLVCGLFLAVIVLRVRRGTPQAVSRVEDLESKLEIVDLLAFRNLVDPEESRVLQEGLSPKMYRRIQRLRTRAAIAYVESVYRNAGLTIRLAEHLSRSPQPEIREEAMRIQALSIRSRFLALISLIKLSTSMVFPAFGASVNDVAEGYARIADRVEALCTLTAPLYTSRIAAAFR